MLTVPPIDAAAPATRVTGSCSPSKVKYALSSRGTSTTSSDPVTIPDTAINFIQAKAGCVIVDFTATTRLDDPPPGVIVIHPFLKESGGTIVPSAPQDAVLNFSTVDGDIRTVQFVFSAVAPGNYTLRMQMHSAGGGAIFVIGPNVVAHYN
jgi:hypothetical protein